MWPYDLGRWDNLKQVVGVTCRPTSDGISWPVVAGCDQYTLTREQLKQKEDKRERTREYQVRLGLLGHQGVMSFFIDSQKLQWSLVPAVSSE